MKKKIFGILFLTLGCGRLQVSPPPTQEVKQPQEKDASCKVVEPQRKMPLVFQGREWATVEKGGKPVEVETGKKCELKVLEECYIGGEKLASNYRAKVDTSLSDEGHKLAAQWVKFDGEDPKSPGVQILSWKQKPELIEIKVPKSQSTVHNPLSVEVVWTHEAHTDTGKCKF